MEELLSKITATLPVFNVRLKNDVISFNSHKTKVGYSIHLKRDQFFIYTGSILLDVCESQEEVIKAFTPEPNVKPN